MAALACAGKRRPLARWARREICQIAFTAAGLRALGVSCDIVNRFSPEFVEGMAGNDNRSLRLGDIGDQCALRTGIGASGDREPHVLLMLFSDADRDRVLRRLDAERCAGRRPVQDRGAVRHRHGRLRAVRIQGRSFAADVRLGSSSHARHQGRSGLHQSDRAGRASARIPQRIWPADGTSVARGERQECRHAAERRAGSSRPRPQRQLPGLSPACTGRARLLALGGRRGGALRHREEGGTGRVDGRAQARRQPARRSHPRSLHSGRQRAPRRQQ